MFIYLVIAAETAIFFTAFWYIYVREPKPLNLSPNPRQKARDLSFTTSSIDATLPAFTKVNTSTACAVTAYDPDRANLKVTHCVSWLTAIVATLSSFTRVMALLSMRRDNNNLGDNEPIVGAEHLPRLSLHRHCRRRSHTIKLFP